MLFHLRLHWFGFWLQGNNSPTRQLGPSSSSLRPSPWTQAAHHDRTLACPVSHTVLNFRDVGSDGPVPLSRFSKFVTPDRFGIADASLSHFVSHVDIVRSTCRHVWRNLRRNHTWYLFSRIRSAQFTKWTQFFFFQRSHGLSQAKSAWCSAPSRTSPPTEIRGRPIVRFPRPQDEDSISRMQRYASLNPCDDLTHRCHTCTRAWQYEGFASIEDHDVAFVITPDTASKGLRTLAPWNVTRLEMSS